MTLLVISTLVGLTVNFSEDAGVELSLATYSGGSWRAYQVALAGYHMGRALLAADQDKNVDSLNEDWAKLGPESLPADVLQEATFSGRIIDECGKLNVNRLRNAAGEIDERSQERLTRLFARLGLEETRAIPVLDWLDADDIQRLDGAESDYYQGLSRPYSCANGPFLTPGQLFLVKGLADSANSEGVQRGGAWLLDYLTIYSDGKVNINTVTREVLESLDEGIDSGIADTILNYRKETPFKRIDELKSAIRMNDTVFNRISAVVAVKSSAFLLDIEGRYQDAVSRIRAIVVRDGNKTKLVYWQVS
jgi:general secretion pathway protein K